MLGGQSQNVSSLISTDPKIISSSLGSNIINRHINFHQIKTLPFDLQVCILNTLMYKFQINLHFFPCGFKSSLNMIQRCWKRNFADNIEAVLLEVSIPFSNTLFDNLDIEFSNILYISGFNREYARQQKKIFGYFVICDVLNENIAIKSREMSHVFTNKNTLKLLSSGHPKLSNFCIKQIKSQIVSDSDKFLSLISGITPLVISDDQKQQDYITPEILTCSEELLGNNVIFLTQGDPFFQNLKTIISKSSFEMQKIHTQKIQWFDDIVLIPNSSIKIIEEENKIETPMDLCLNEKILFYFKGFKFLSFIPEQNQRGLLKINFQNITIEKSRNPRFLPPITPGFKNKKKIKKRINKVAKEGKNISVYRNCLLSVAKNHMLEKMTWVLRIDGSFDIIVGEDFFRYLISGGFVAAGHLKWNKNMLEISEGFHLPKFNKSKMYIENNLLQDPVKHFYFTYLFKKYPPCKDYKTIPVKKKKTIIQDEKPQRNNISIFSSLLSGDR